MSPAAGTEQIVVLFDYPVSRRDMKRLGIESLRRYGFDVQIWELTPFIHPDVHRDVRVPDPVPDGERRLMRSLAETRAALKALPDDCFILSVVYYHPRAIPVYRAIGRRGLRYGVMMVNALPRISTSAGVSIGARLARLTPQKAWWFLLRRIPFSVLGVPTASLVAGGGRESVSAQSGLFPISPQSEILWTHSFDYDIYLEERERPPSDPVPPYAVFLDEYLPFHPDYTYLKMAPPSTPEAYFPPLRRFFDGLEARHGLPVVVAAHPRARYEEHPDLFGGRRIIRDRTAALVAHAAFVIAHSSTAIGFAALFRKPVVFVTTPAIDAHPHVGPYVRGMAAQFGKQPIDVSVPRDVAWEQELRVDEAAYAEYVDRYIKRRNTPDTPLWRVLANRLSGLHDRLPVGQDTTPVGQDFSPAIAAQTRRQD